MKALKILAIAFVANMAVANTAAQDNLLKIRESNGTTSEYSVTGIKEVSFPTELPSLETVTENVDGHDCVDLGLPSGLKWATVNIGADEPQEDGNYYGYGELETKGTYDIFKGKYNKYTFQELQGMGIINSEGALTPQYDVASQLWGYSWHTPTVADYQELVENCTWLWLDPSPVTDYVAGVLVTGPNGNSIFLPACGNYHGFYGEHGRYWTANACDKDDSSLAFFFDKDSRYCTKELRGIGIPVRAVTGAGMFVPTEEYFLDEWNVAQVRDIDLETGDYEDSYPEGLYYRFSENGVLEFGNSQSQSQWRIDNGALYIDDVLFQYTVQNNDSFCLISTNGQWQTIHYLHRVPKIPQLPKK